MGVKISRWIGGFLPQQRGFGTSSSLSPPFQLLSMYGPVPVGCCVAYVPVGWKTPFEATEPWFAPYFTIAVGLSIENEGAESALMNESDRCVRYSLTVDLPNALQPR